MNMLKINGLNIEIGKTVDKEKLFEHKIKRPSLISRLIIKKEPGQIIWWSKNCNISCFEDNFILYPNLDTSSGSDMMFGTSAYLFYKENVLEKVTFQMIGNALAANIIFEKFNESATETYGEPRNEGLKIIWEKNQNKIIAEKGLNSPHVYFHWILK